MDAAEKAGGDVDAVSIFTEHVPEKVRESAQIGETQEEAMRAVLDLRGRGYDRASSKLQGYDDDAADKIVAPERERRERREARRAARKSRSSSS